MTYTDQYMHEFQNKECITGMNINISQDIKDNILSEYHLASQVTKSKSASSFKVLQFYFPSAYTDSVLSNRTPALLIITLVLVIFISGTTFLFH